VGAHEREGGKQHRGHLRGCSDDLRRPVEDLDEPEATDVDAQEERRERAECITERNELDQRSSAQEK